MDNQKQINTNQAPVIATQNSSGFFGKLPSQYDPNNLLNALIKHFSLKNDAALARTLGMSSLIIKNIRLLSQPMSGTILILIQEKTKLSLSELRMYMGDRRQKFRIRDGQSNLVGST